MADVINAIDVTDQCKPIERAKPPKEKFILQVYNFGNGFWDLVCNHDNDRMDDGFDTYQEAYEPGDIYGCETHDRDLRRVFRLGDPKPVAIDWDSVLRDVTRKMSGLPPQSPMTTKLVAVVVGFVCGEVESQLKGSSDGRTNNT